MFLRFVLGSMEYIYIYICMFFLCAGWVRQPSAPALSQLQAWLIGLYVCRYVYVCGSAREWSCAARSDLHVVSGGTSAHALALVVRQLRALGIPYLHDIAGLSESLDARLELWFLHDVDFSSQGRAGA